jgi:hypothetical protein
MESLSTDSAALAKVPLTTGVPRGRRGFWALIATQFQGAFSDNILRNVRFPDDSSAEFLCDFLVTGGAGRVLADSVETKLAAGVTSGRVTSDLTCISVSPNRHTQRTVRGRSPVA